MAMCIQIAKAVRWIALTAIVAGCQHRSVPLPRIAASSLGDTSALVERGEYIVRNVSVCGSCHTSDRKPDEPLVGGAEFKDWRLGTVRSANLTPDSATGLGTWTESEIVRAIRNGERKDGRLLAPVMRYEWFHEMSDRDAFAAARYLKTLPAVSNRVTQSPNLIFHVARALFLGPIRGEAAPPPQRGSTVEYGRYLSRIALCVDCHTPTSGLQSKLDRDRLFSGQSHPPKDFIANPSNLTPDSLTGIGRWTEADFLGTIRTGDDPQGHTLNDFMPWRQLRRMSDDDLRAIYVYLRTVPPLRNQVPRRVTVPVARD
jgi:mono/diheme cytochrome c family protein